jgi:hypothetical protein
MVESSSEVRMLFAYPEPLSAVPKEQLPQGPHSIALTVQDIAGLSSVDLTLAPSILALDEENVVFAQSAYNETFAEFHQRVQL